LITLSVASLFVSFLFVRNAGVVDPCRRRSAPGPAVGLDEAGLDEGGEHADAAAIRRRHSHRRRPGCRALLEGLLRGLAAAAALARPWTGRWPGRQHLLASLIRTLQSRQLGDLRQRQGREQFEELGHVRVPALRQYCQKS
jgi:hypothetical protein